jgi:hypothetical protein
MAVYMVGKHPDAATSRASIEYVADTVADREHAVESNGTFDELCEG